jgi:hypothetical protein
VQDLTKPAIAAAPTPHGEEGGRPQGACYYMSMCIRNSALPLATFAKPYTTLAKPLFSYTGTFYRSKLFSQNFGFFLFCVCVHIKVDSNVMFCFNFLDLSLYDVKYKCLPNIEIYIYIYYRYGS